MAQPILKRIGIVDVVFGENVTVVEPCNLYGCVIGADTFVGPFVEIQQEARIGASCRIQSHAFICGMVTIGDRCFISHGAKFVNDPFRIGRPARRDATLYRSTTLADDVTVGTNATILPVSICSHAVIGAGAVVTKDICEPGIYAGNPARLIRRLDPSSPNARNPDDPHPHG